MALPAPDMDDCCKKERCLVGPNAGQIYSTCDPCQGTGVFNGETCDCEGCDVTSATVYWKVSYATYGTGCTPETTTCTGFGGDPYSFAINNLAIGGEIEVTTQESETIGTCSGTKNTEVVAIYPACIDGTSSLGVKVLGAPGCSVNSSSGAIATPYDVSIEYD